MSVNIIATRAVRNCKILCAANLPADKHVGEPQRNGFSFIFILFYVYVIDQFAMESEFNT